MLNTNSNKKQTFEVKTLLLKIATINNKHQERHISKIVASADSCMNFVMSLFLFLILDC